MRRCRARSARTAAGLEGWPLAQAIAVAWRAMWRNMAIPARALDRRAAAMEDVEPAGDESIQCIGVEGVQGAAVA